MNSLSPYDLLIIGSGPAGYVAAIRASQLGMRTAVVERESLGGVCLNWGCIPTKALLKSAEVYDTLRNAAAYGLECRDVACDLEKIIERSRRVVKQLSAGVGYLLKKNNVHYIPGTARIISPTTVLVSRNGEEREIPAKNILIATGARPRDLPAAPRDGEIIISSKEALTQKNLPRRLVIIGAGPIGVEFAYFYGVLGAHVTLIEIMDEILPMVDREIAAVVHHSFEKRGIKAVVSATVEKVKQAGSEVYIVYTQNGRRSEMNADKVLVAVGVVGNTEDLGLESAGVKVSNGRIEVDKSFRTAIPSIWAAGDVIGPPWLAHVASAEGICAVEHMAGVKTRPIDYNAIPSCVYCQPQVATIGLSEEKTKQLGLSIRVGKYSFRASGRAVASNEADGFVKLLFDSRQGGLIGAHIVGHDATEMIAELGLAKSMQATAEQIAHTIHAHPTLSEAIMEAALDSEGRRMHGP